ncbi:hypothetical protein DL93DRAFT_2087612 [Clavulina sp. PMI_390]|nr:hypothetical protein DL93DRAFT_2087612 [Clavulina sp. PMI_390]
MLWLFFAFVLSTPLISWFLLEFPSVLYITPFTVGGVLNRIMLCIAESFIVSGLLFWNIYGVFWTMNKLRLSPPSLERQTEWSAVERAARSLWFAAGNIIWALGGRYIPIDSIREYPHILVDRQRRANDQVNTSSLLWQRLKPLAALVFFAAYFYVWAQCIVEMDVWMHAFWKSLPALDFGESASHSNSTFPPYVAVYMFIIFCMTLVSYYLLLVFVAYTSLPIAWYLGLLGKWAQPYAAPAVWAFFVGIAWLCSSRDTATPDVLVDSMVELV